MVVDAQSTIEDVDDAIERVSEFLDCPECNGDVTAKKRRLAYRIECTEDECGYAEWYEPESDWDLL